MTRTFLVALDFDPLSDADSIAADLLDSLSQDGFQVTSVKPWASAMTNPVDEPISLLGPSPSTNFLG